MITALTDNLENNVELFHSHDAGCYEHDGKKPLETLQNTGKVTTHRVRMIDCSDPPPITICPGIDIKILASELGKCCGDPNEDSLVLQLVVNGKPTALFVGDLEGSAVQELIQFVALKGCSLQSEILRLAHHGSTKKNANSEDFLDAVSPTAAFSSSDPGHKSFRHPHCSAMKWFDSAYKEQEDIKHPYICNGNKYTTKLKHHLY